MNIAGEDIKTLRQRLGWSLADLSRRLGCSVVRLKSLEIGAEAALASEMEQLSYLTMHLSRYNQQLESGPRAEVALRTMGYNQIHFKDLKN